MSSVQQLSVPHVLGIKYLATSDVELILETAKEFKEVINRPIKKVPSLRDVTIANLFFENPLPERYHLFLNENRLGIPFFLLGFQMYHPALLR